MAQRKGRLINVLLKDGTPSRVPMERAEQLLDQGKAVRYISNTVFKALSLGIEVKNLGTKDRDGKLKAKIQALQSSHKAEKPAEEQEDRPEAETRQKKRRRRKRSPASA